jgi:hypothetical protein
MVGFIPAMLFRNCCGTGVVSVANNRLQHLVNAACNSTIVCWALQRAALLLKRPQAAQQA